MFTEIHAARTASACSELALYIPISWLRKPCCCIDCSYCSLFAYGALLLVSHQMHKEYTALVQKPVPLGVITHWHDKRSGMVQRLSHTPPAAAATVAPTTAAAQTAAPRAEERWRIAQLNVLSCTELSLPTAADSDSSSTYYELKIDLMTGRKHQIRAQLAAIGCPIVGDTLYAPTAGLVAGIGSAAAAAGTSSADSTSDSSEEQWLRACKQCVPPVEGAAGVPQFGLQASVLTLLHDGSRYEAGKPWWRM
jgi:RNA pseudouridylate synthase